MTASSIQFEQDVEHAGRLVPISYTNTRKILSGFPLNEPKMSGSHDCISHGQRLHLSASAGESGVW